MARTYEQMRDHMLRIRKLNTRRPRPGRTRPRRKHGPKITKERFIRALRGTGGVKTRIARRLRVLKETLMIWLHKPENLDMLALFVDERDAGIDYSESTIIDCVRQRDDLPTALSASKFMLTHRGHERGYNARPTEIKLSGGVTNTNINIPDTLIDIDALDLPLDIRKAILTKAEQAGVKPTPPISPGKILFEQHGRFPKQIKRMTKRTIYIQRVTP